MFSLLWTSWKGQGIDLWLDGGWGVDALLGEQTRLHDDLDIVLEHKHVPTLRHALAGLGFRDIRRDDTRPWNFVLGDGRGLEVDVRRRQRALFRQSRTQYETSPANSQKRI
jgi:hypothetical protein